MRIEVQIGNEDPKVYPLVESKIIIGSGETAHIQIPITEGISRKHLQIAVEGDKYYVTDLGSSNGSFINEDRLVPGSKQEFTSFFPVRLAENVLISLLGDDEAMPEGGSLQELLSKPAKVETPTPRFQQEDSDKTMIISRSSLNLPNRPQLRPRKANTQAATKKKASSNMNSTYIFVGVLLSVAIIYQFNFRENEVVSTPEETTEAASTPTPSEQTATQNGAADNKEVVQEEARPEQIPLEEIPSMNDFKLALNDLKCTTNFEKKICEVIPEGNVTGNGAIDSVGKMIIVIPEKKWLNESFVIFKPGLVPPFIQIDQSQRTKLFFLYLVKALPTFNWVELEKNLFFIFHRQIDGSKTISSIVGVRSKDLPGLLKLMSEKFKEIPLQQRGKEALIPFDPFITLIKFSDLIAPLENEKTFTNNSTTTTIPTPTQPISDEPIQIQAPKNYRPVQVMPTQEPIRPRTNDIAPL